MQRHAAGWGYKRVQQVEALCKSRPLSGPPLRRCSCPSAAVAAPDTAQKRLDAILILGGGLAPDGSLPPWVERRVAVAHALWQQQSRPIPILCLGGGTPHKAPVLNSTGHVIHEATAIASGLLEREVPAQSQLKEISSYDTVGNAYYSLTIHALPAGWSSLAVVTSEFHMSRTQALFSHIYGSATPQFRAKRFELTFVAASDEGLFDAGIAQARRLKEAEAVRRFKAEASELTTLAEVHQWMHQTHRCYAVARQHERTGNPTADARLLATY